jgi:hypothetical protein
VVVLVGWLLPLALAAQGPEGARPLTPPPEYRTWWQDVAAHCDCDPATTFEHLLWYEVPGETFACGGPDRCAAGRDADDIILLAHRWVRSVAVVQHEMLHALLGGDPQHRHHAWLRYFATPARGL